MLKKILCIALLALATLLVMPTDEAQAFCGFYVSGADGELYNDATQVVMLRDGTRTVLSMQNHYSGPPEDFAMVIPVPVVLKEKNVKTLSHDVFKRIDRLAAPRLVEYWERDPCAPDELMDFGRGCPNCGAVQGGGGARRLITKKRPAVRIEAQFAVGEYDVVILSADDSMSLETWLKQEKYNIPAGAEPVLRPYIESGMKFFVAKVNLDKVQKENGRVVLSPLRFFYDTDTFSLPVRLGLLNAKGAQDLIIHILAKNQRYESANMPNATIPTNIEVHDAVKGRFGEFYAALFDETQKKTPSAVVTEYSWSSQKCDPCPGPVLSNNDIMTFGADVLSDKNTNGYVLTRLHARYSAAELKDDLVFKAAPPIVGGRETHGAKGLEKGATPSGANNFQGRYIIRHPWEGKVACETPNYGRWGGPNGADKPSANAAENTAFAPRGKIKLKEILAEDVTELSIEAKTKRKQHK